MILRYIYTKKLKKYQVLCVLLYATYCYQYYSTYPTTAAAAANSSQHSQPIGVLTTFHLTYYTYKYIIRYQIV